MGGTLDFNMKNCISHGKERDIALSMKPNIHFYKENKEMYNMGEFHTQNVEWKMAGSKDTYCMILFTGYWLEMGHMGIFGY